MELMSLWKIMFSVMTQQLAPLMNLLQQSLISLCLHLLPKYQLDFLASLAPKVHKWVCLIILHFPIKLDLHIHP
uniref:Uncharacterized protein n=1 Tax=Rhizophora mucronata TaxID=61149 RepID=A0A2P2IRY9_RHIMU